MTIAVIAALKAPVYVYVIAKGESMYFYAGARQSCLDVTLRFIACQSLLRNIQSLNPMTIPRLYIHIDLSIPRSSGHLATGSTASNGDVPINHEAVEIAHDDAAHVAK